MNEQMQQQFEQAYSEDNGGIPAAFIKLQRLGESYSVPKVARAWYWFKRSRLVIELPKPYAVVGDYAACGGGKLVWDVEYAEKITDRMCEKTAVYDRAILEAAGLKVAQ